MKDYAEMTLVELVEAYTKELDNLKDQIPNSQKFNWLRCPSHYSKVLRMRGYLMGIKDCGKNIGDLRLILEMISIELEDERRRGNNE